MDQKVLIVENDDSIQKLNDLLKSGWRIETTCPMPPQKMELEFAAEKIVKGYAPVCMVVLEKTTTCVKCGDAEVKITYVPKGTPLLGEHNLDEDKLHHKCQRCTHSWMEDPRDKKGG